MTVFMMDGRENVVCTGLPAFVPIHHWLSHWLRPPYCQASSCCPLWVIFSSSWIEIAERMLMCIIKILFLPFFSLIWDSTVHACSLFSVSIYFFFPFSISHLIYFFFEISFFLLISFLINICTHRFSSSLIPSQSILIFVVAYWFQITDVYKLVG